MLKLRRTKAIIIQLVKPCGIMLFTMLLSLCEPVDGLLPFAIASLIALRNVQYAVIPAFLGVSAAALMRDFSLYSVTLWILPAALLIPVLLYMRKKQKDRQFICMLALCVCGGIGMLCSNMLPYDIIMGVLSLLCGCAMLPILKPVTELALHIKERTALTKAELHCINAVACLLIISLPKAEVSGFSLYLFAVLLYIFLCSAALGTAGLAGAMLSCGLMLLAGYPVAQVFAVCFMAFLSALLRDVGRYGMAIGALLGNLIITLCVNRTLSFLVPLPSLIAAAVPTLFVSRASMRRLQGLSGSADVPSSSQQQLARRTLNEIEQRLKRTASVFNRLSQIFTESKSDRRAAVCAGTAAKMCSGCARYEYCWHQRYCDTHTDFRTLATLVVQAGTLSPYDVPTGIKTRCHNWVQLLVCMNTLNAEPQEQQGDSALMARQCRSIAELLSRLFDSNETVAYDYDAEQRLCESFIRHGLRIKEVVCRTQHGILRSVTVVRPSCQGDRTCTADVIKVLNACFNADFICDTKFCNCGGGSCSCEYIPSPRLKATCCAARRSKDGQKVCGDSFTLTAISGGKYLAAISDGMGSGQAAANESERAVAMLEALFAGGLDEQSTYQLLNRLLRIKKSEGYSTLDACVLDLCEGTCSWGKIGAVPGYIVRGGNVTAVSGSSLPLGAVGDIEPSVSNSLIRDGDVIVLISDGIYDALGAGDALPDVLPDLCTLSAQEIADSILQQALLAGNGQARDDMTALAVKITA